VEGVEAASCGASSNYGERNFAVLFDSCTDGSGIFDNISPPWYIIFPIAITIIICLILVFGGALLADEKLRKRKVKNKLRSKRSARIKRMVSHNTTQSDSSSIM